MGLAEIYTKFKKKYQVQIESFFIILIIGLLVHLYAITNKFFNYFEMGNILADMSYSQNDTLGLGRWFLPVASNWITDFSLPLVNGIICSTLMGIAAIMITELLQIRKKIYVCLFGGVWMTFPGIASVYSYGVNSDAFVLSIFLAVLSVYIGQKFKYGMIIGGTILAFSLGIYQPYMAIAIAVIYCVLFRELFTTKFNSKDFIFKALKDGFMLLLGFIIYYIILKICLAVNNTELSNYHGINEMTSFSIKGIAKGFVYSYMYFLKNFFSMDYVYTVGRIFWNILGVLILGGSSLIIIKRLERKNKARYFWIFIMVCLLPIGVNAAPFLMADRVGNGVDRYMLFSLLLFWALLLKNIEIMEINKFLDGLMYKIIYWLGCIALGVCIVSSTLICNQAYHRMEAMTNATNAYLTRMVARMESIEGWNKELPVYFVNPRNLVNDNFEVQIAKYDELKNLPGTELKPWYSERAIVQYMEVYLHFPINVLAEDDKQKMEVYQEIDNMAAYPAVDSIKIIDGVMVVKVSD